MNGVLAGVGLVLVLALAGTGYALKGALEDKAAAVSKLDTAQSANRGLADSLNAQGARHVAELAKRDKQLEDANAIVVKLHANEKTINTAAREWQTRFNRLQREAPDSCWNTLLPDAAFGESEP